MKVKLKSEIYIIISVLPAAFGKKFWMKYFFFFSKKLGQLTKRSGNLRMSNTKQPIMDNKRLAALSSKHLAKIYEKLSFLIINLISQPERTSVNDCAIDWLPSITDNIQSSLQCIYFEGHCNWGYLRVKSSQRLGRLTME